MFGVGIGGRGRGIGGRRCGISGRRCGTWGWGRGISGRGRGDLDGDSWVAVAGNIARSFSFAPPSSSSLSPSSVNQPVKQVSKSGIRSIERWRSTVFVTVLSLLVSAEILKKTRRSASRIWLVFVLFGDDGEDVRDVAQDEAAAIMQWARV